VLASRDNPYAPFSHAPPLSRKGPRLASRGDAAENGVCVSETVLCGGAARIDGCCGASVALMRSPREMRGDRWATQSPLKAASRWPNQPPPQSAVAVRARIDAANGRMSSPHPTKRCAYWQASARTCRRYRRNRAFVVMLRLALRDRALWKSKPDLMGAVVPTTGMAEVGDITRLACLMDSSPYR